jgi:hypothetical protein
VPTLSRYQLTAPILDHLPIDAVTVEAVYPDIYALRKIRTSQFAQKVARITVGLSNIYHAARAIWSVEPVEDEGGSAVEKHVGIKHELPATASSMKVSQLAQMRADQAEAPKFRIPSTGKPCIERRLELLRSNDTYPR